MNGNYCEDVVFDSIDELADELVNKALSDEDWSGTVVCDFENMRALIRAIMLYEDITFEAIDIHNPETKGYADEFVLDIGLDGDRVVIGCEPAKRGGKYIHIGSRDGDTYVFGDCDSRVLYNCESDNTYIVFIEDEDESGEIDNADDSQVHGFTANKSDENSSVTISYNTNVDLDKDVISRFLRKYGFTDYDIM